MDFHFIFCADGILRMQYTGKPIAIPVSFIQEQENIKDDYKFWFNWWNKTVVFEQGLTFGKFIECLSPWEIFWSNYTGINIEAYLKEGHKLSLVSDPAPFDWLLCRRYHTISALVKHNPEIDLNTRLSSAYSPKILPAWGFRQQIMLSGYKFGEDDYFNVAGYPLNVIYNIPLFLNTTDIVSILDTPYHKDSNQHLQTIFNDNGYGMESVEGLSYFNSPNDFSLRDLMGSIFYDFEITPAERELATEELKHQIGQAMIEIEGDLLENELPDEKTVVIPEASLHGLHVEMQAEINYWEHMINFAKKSCPEPLKIGKIESGVEPVEYIYGYRKENGEI